MRYAKPDPANPTGEWVVHTVSEKGPWTAHGIGAGDVNGDGEWTYSVQRDGGSSRLRGAPTESPGATTRRHLAGGHENPPAAEKSAFTM